MLRMINKNCYYIQEKYIRFLFSRFKSYQTHTRMHITYTRTYIREHFDLSNSIHSEIRYYADNKTVE